MSGSGLFQRARSFWTGGAVFLCLFLSCPLSAKGKTVWIKPLQIPLADFRAHIQALGAPHITYAEHQRLRLSAKAEEFHLIDRIQKAQEFYLSGDLPSAKKSFQEITALAHKADWSEEDRRIVLYGFLRLAQIETRPEKKKALLLSAGHFSRKRMTAENPDYKLFPPPLTEMFNSLLESQTRLTVKWREVFPEHEVILINGEEAPRDIALQMPESSYRVTALSSSHAPYSKTVRLSRLLSHTISVKPLTAGYCENLKIKPEWSGPSVRLLFPKKCPDSLQLSRSQPLSRDELKPTDKGYISISISEGEKGEKAERDSLKKNPKVSKWIWVAGGAIALGFLIYVTGTGSQSGPKPPVYYD